MNRDVIVAHLWGAYNGAGGDEHFPLRMAFVDLVVGVDKADPMMIRHAAKELGGYADAIEAQPVADACHSCGEPGRELRDQRGPEAPRRLICRGSFDRRAAVPACEPAEPSWDDLPPPRNHAEEIERARALAKQEGKAR